MAAKWLGSMGIHNPYKVRLFTTGLSKARNAGLESRAISKGDPPAYHSAVSFGFHDTEHRFTESPYKQLR
jgi:hypothetical protein